MSTIRELEYDVRESLRQYTDDSEISSRYIMYLWGIKRSKYLRNDLNNLQKTIDTSILQTLCLELEEVNVNQCGLDLECETIMRTKKPIPKPLELHLKSALTTVKPTNRIELPFNFVTKQRAIFSKYSTFNQAVYAFLDDDMHIYLISENDAVKLIECITVTGIFENPLDLKNYFNCCGCEQPSTCFNEDTTQYPIQAHHIDSIREEIIKTLIGSLQIPEDKNNNSDDI
jgi:hypothetical protein